jgi:thiol-disulfide isomerase/thioredoxin
VSSVAEVVRRAARLAAPLCLLAALATTAIAQRKLDSVKPWLGVAIDKATAGVLVTDVLPDTPAAGAGFARGDVITAVDAVKVADPKELIQAVQNAGVGTEVKVHYLRDGKPLEKVVALVAKPDELGVLRQRLVDRPAPAFNFTAMNTLDVPVTKDALKGRVVILEAWATWCPACQMTLPKLTEMAKKYPVKDLVVLVISDEDEATIKRFVDANKPAYVVARDTTEALSKEWAVSAIPMSAVIDRDGKVVHATIGAGSYADETIAIAEKLVTAK